MLAVQPLVNWHANPNHEKIRNEPQPSQSSQFFFNQEVAMNQNNNFDIQRHALQQTLLQTVQMRRAELERSVLASAMSQWQSIDASLPAQMNIAIPSQLGPATNVQLPTRQNAANLSVSGNSSLRTNFSAPQLPVSLPQYPENQNTNWNPPGANHSLLGSLQNYGALHPSLPTMHSQQISVQSYLQQPLSNPAVLQNVNTQLSSLLPVDRGLSDHTFQYASPIHANWQGGQVAQQREPSQQLSQNNSPCGDQASNFLNSAPPPDKHGTHVHASQPSSSSVADKERPAQRPPKPVAAAAAGAPKSGRGRGHCEHGRRRSDCKECKGAGICEHNKRRSLCKECGGSCICPHGRIRYQCKLCGGSQICEHNRRRSHCKDCRGSAICEHGRQRHQCQKCKKELEDMKAKAEARPAEVPLAAEPEVPVCVHRLRVSECPECREASGTGSATNSERNSDSLSRSSADDRDRRHRDAPGSASPEADTAQWTAMSAPTPPALSEVAAGRSASLAWPSTGKRSLLDSILEANLGPHHDDGED